MLTSRPIIWSILLPHLMRYRLSTALFPHRSPTSHSHFPLITGVGVDSSHSAWLSYHIGASICTYRCLAVQLRRVRGDFGHPLATRLVAVGDRAFAIQLRQTSRTVISIGGQMVQTLTAFHRQLKTHAFTISNIASYLHNNLFETLNKRSVDHVGLTSSFLASDRLTCLWCSAMPAVKVSLTV